MEVTKGGAEEAQVKDQAADATEVQGEPQKKQVHINELFQELYNEIGRLNAIIGEQSNAIVSLINRVEKLEK